MCSGDISGNHTLYGIRYANVQICSEKKVFVQELRPYSCVPEISRDVWCYCLSTGNSYCVSTGNSYCVSTGNNYCVSTGNSYCVSTGNSYCVSTGNSYDVCILICLVCIVATRTFKLSCV